MGKLSNQSTGTQANVKCFEVVRVHNTKMDARDSNLHGTHQSSDQVLSRPEKIVEGH